MPDLLLELFSEEIPARMQGRRPTTCAGWSPTRWSARARLRGRPRLRDAAPAGAGGLGLPAAAATCARSARARASARPKARCRAFSKSAGLASIDQASIQSDPKKGDFYVAVTERPGRPTLEVIAGMVPDVAQLSLAEIDALGRSVRASPARCAGCGRCIRSSRPSGRRPRSPKSCRSSRRRRRRQR